MAARGAARLGRGTRHEVLSGAAALGAALPIDGRQFLGRAARFLAEGEKGATDTTKGLSGGRPSGAGDTSMVATRFSVLDPFTHRGGAGRGTSGSLSFRSSQHHGLGEGHPDIWKQTYLRMTGEVRSAASCHCMRGAPAGQCKHRRSKSPWYRHNTPAV